MKRLVDGLAETSSPSATPPFERKRIAQAASAAWMQRPVRQGAPIHGEGSDIALTLSDPSDLLYLARYFLGLRAGELARPYWQRVLDRWAQRIELVRQVADMLMQNGQTEDAVGVYRLALQHAPDDAELNNNLGVALKWIGRYEQAILHFRTALTLAPPSELKASLLVNLGSALFDIGLTDEARTEFLSALEIRPDDAATRSNALLLALHGNDFSPGQLLLEHRAFDGILTAPRITHSPPLRSDARRRPRVAFISADLRRHPIATLLAPAWNVFTALRGHNVFAYHSHPVEDAVSREFQKTCNWRNIYKDSDDQLVSRIRHDQIDVLIDLSGHTGGNRLTALARKPAPVQMSWLGYPYSTGLDAVDYYVTDRHWIPPNSAKEHFIEELIRLPAAATFQYPEDAPEVNLLPRLSKNHWTFGSFNRPGKINDTTVDLWGRALQTAPGSRMLIGGTLGTTQNAQIAMRLMSAGISVHRIEFVPRCPMREYLKLHHHVDLLLDTLPYSAGTTSLFGAWMGVPTLTIDTALPQGRQTAAIMLHLGLEDFIAADACQWADRASSILSDPAFLNSVRLGLRNRLRGSPICDHAGLATALSEAVDRAWGRHLQGLPPKSIAVPQVAA